MLRSKLNGTNRVLDQLDLLALKPNKRRRIVRGAGRMVRRSSKRRLSQQEDLTGKTWQGRSNGRRKKMLTKLGRHLQVHTTNDTANITFANTRIGQVAKAHQIGADIDVTAAEAKRERGMPNYKGPSTRKQAKALIEAGYQIRRKRGKGWKKPSISWILSNLSLGQAGIILRLMRDEPAKQSWTISLPDRSFLGQDAAELKQMKNYILDEAVRLS